MLKTIMALSIPLASLAHAESFIGAWSGTASLGVNTCAEKPSALTVSYKVKQARSSPGYSVRLRGLSLRVASRPRSMSWGLGLDVVNDGEQCSSAETWRISSIRSGVGKFSYFYSIGCSDGRSCVTSYSATLRRR